MPSAGSVPPRGPEAGSSESTADPLRRLVAVMDRLRSPGGCPWDAEQTHASLLSYLLEETYETIESVETADVAGLQEELGDLLLQVVFHARIAAESAPGFDIDDVANGITDKLIRRHPHVFGDADAPEPEVAEQTWFEIKSAEKGRTSVTDGVPMGLPPLALLTKLQHRARAGGVDLLPTDDLALVVAADALACLGDDEEALARLLAAVVVTADARDWDAEAVARGAARAYRQRLRAEEEAEGSGAETDDPGA